MSTPADVREAAARLKDRVLRTPLRQSPWLSARTGGTVFLKLETLQPTFSYKIRGATHAVDRYVDSTAAPRPLVTASAGNHGRALAYAAAARHLDLTVYVPESAPHTKLASIRALGATLRPCRDYDAAEQLAREHAAGGAAHYISPYNHPDVVAGAGTVGLEILEQQPDVQIIVVAVGGGGLISGIALAAHGFGEGVSVVGVEAAASSPFTHSRAAGRIVPIDVRPTLADGLAGNLDPDTVTFDLVQRLVPRILTVSEAEIAEAMRGVAVEERLIVEGAAAVAVAPLLSGKLDVAGRRAAVVLSGANVDPETLKRVL